MNRRKVDSKRERRILIAMVTSKVFLSQARKALDPEILEAPHYKIITEWCFEHYDEYGKAPGKHVEDLYNSWSEDNDNTELVDAVRDFLESLSGEYDQDAELNIPFLVDELGEFIAKRNVVRLQQDVEYSMVHGETKKAEETLLAYRSVQVGVGAGFDPLNDEEAWGEVFAEASGPLIHFEGDAGDFFNAALTRDAFVGVQAPEKTGKTFYLTEFAVRALQQRLRVALFQVGDLSKNQILRRLGVRWSGHPMRKRDCGRIPMPVRIKVDEEEDLGYSIEYITKKVKRPMDAHLVKQGRDHFKKAYGLKKGKTYIKSSVHATGSITVRDIQGILEQWKVDEGFIPDVIIIDYADILAPENPKAEFRHQVNDTWMAMRKMSQNWHALVITATQSSAEAYTDEPILQTMKHKSEDKRKFAHVTGMLGLNRTSAEKEACGMRLNWIVLRESNFNTNRPLYVGTCFALGKAICCAKL